MVRLKTNFAHFIRNEELILLVFCICISISFIFWTLLNSILSILFFVYWLIFVNKKFSLKDGNSLSVIIFCLLYLVSFISFFYSENKEIAYFKLQQKSA